MTPADQYRVKAGDMAAMARAEQDPFQRAEYERLSLSYLRLAEQSERNSQNDVVWFDPLIDKPTEQPQVQQQQQPQPPSKEDESPAVE